MSQRTRLDGLRPAILGALSPDPRALRSGVARPARDPAFAPATRGQRTRADSTTNRPAVDLILAPPLRGPVG